VSEHRLRAQCGRTIFEAGVVLAKNADAAGASPA
jgi:hypothetical protein